MKKTMKKCLTLLLALAMLLAMAVPAAAEEPKLFPHDHLYQCRPGRYREGVQAGVV